MGGNYQQLIEFISESSGVSIEDIKRRVEAKQAKLSGLISKEGAAQVIASELNINFEKQLVKICHLVSGMRNINVFGKIIEMSPVREYNKNSRNGRIASFILADESGNIRTVLWDENHIELIVKGEIVEGSLVEINNAGVRNTELHLGSFSDIKISDKILNSVVTERVFLNKNISDFSFNENVSARAFIVNMFEPRFFEVCQVCRKKIVDNECIEHGKVIGEKRSLLSFVIDDGTGSIRATVFSEVLEKIMEKNEIENSELFALKKQDFLGKELVIKGQVRRNSMFDNYDFIVSEIGDVDIDKLIQELEMS